MKDKSRYKFIRMMIRLAFEEIKIHGSIVFDGSTEPSFITVVTHYGGKANLTVAEVMEVLPEFKKDLKKYKDKIKLPEGIN